MLPVTVPVSSVEELLSSPVPLKVEPFGRVIGSFSFFGVSDPHTAQFLNVYGIVTADAEETAKDRMPTAATAAAIAASGRVERYIGPPPASDPVVDYWKYSGRGGSYTKLRPHATLLLRN